MFLALAELWGALAFFLVLEGLIIAAVILKRTGRWPKGLTFHWRWWVGLVALLLLLVLGATVGVQIYTDYLWFEEIGYTVVFTTQILTRLALFFGTLLVVGLFLGSNLHLALRWLPRQRWFDEQRLIQQRFWQRVGPLVAWAAAAFVGLLFATSVQARWMDVLRFLNAADAGLSDPLFGIDLGYYLFRLGLLQSLKGALVWLTCLTLAAVALIYLVGIRRLEMPARPTGHLSVLGVLVLLVMFWHYRLQIPMLLFSEGGAAFGAGYTDVHARWPALQILSWIVLGCAAILLLNLWRRTWRLLAAGLGLWLVFALVVGTIYPALVQALVVRPSELDMERPYITHSIEFTLDAYGLAHVHEETFPLTGTLTLATIAENPGTIENIRLWDHRPLRDTYQQLQALRPYYDFKDIDVERYTLGGKYRQVVLSARELSVDRLAETAQTWLNRHLQYTHGYGLTLSPVNQVCGEGQPCFLLRDVPARTDYPELRLERPEIYFGEESDNYILVGTTTKEFDYPLGDQNATTTYAGSGGIPIGTGLRRLAFALRFGDLPLLVSEYITPESRILFHRTIQERVTTIAPFLGYDYDPYPVILDGHIYWIQDAYTFSDMYPYAQPFDDPYGELERFYGYNYFRNSVKVVIDAYNGTTMYYLVDPTDPVAQTYGRMFPGLFRPVEEMPAGLRAHWRYPENLFRIQTHIYATYHMRDPQVFYNKEDAWVFAQERYGDVTQPIDSYYVIMKLPGWEQEEFFLMVPYTPATRDNMIAWMHVQCDGSEYGRLGIYKFPKQTLVYGPYQIEARLNQNPLISQQLTLWGQRGSSVIRGNLLVIPIDRNLLYVAPIYLQAETGKIPELQRVIVAYGERIVMATTLEDGLRQVLAAGPAPTEGETWQGLVAAANEHYRRAQDCLKEGNWGCYGSEMQALQATLEELARLAEER